jgi:uncharacterized protein (TIGR03118 family)
LVNAWGIAFNPTGVVWVANNGSSTSTLYNGSGIEVLLGGDVVHLDGPPTGIVFNTTTAFGVGNGTSTGSAKFIFATEDGTIAGWAPNVNLNHALKAVDNSSSGAVYKGLAIAAGGSGPLIYATDFHNARVDVFDGNFKPVVAAGAFVDPHLPPGYAPFGIQTVNGDVYVTYAVQDAARHDNVNGAGLGIVDVFDANGRFLRRVVSQGRLNAPWGIALAPAGFGRFANHLLIGNFGDGHIGAYEPATGHLAGQLRTIDHRPLKIDGLWGLAFGNGFAGQSADALYFTAGPADEAHGLYGRIDAVQGDYDRGDDD